MSDISRKLVKCAKCGKESQQLIVYSVNYYLEGKENGDKLLHHKQKCPYCNYEAVNIGAFNGNNKLSRDEIIKITEDNVPRAVYGIPDFIRNKEKYDVKPEDNVPRVVYGIPDFIRNKEKYDIKPENNVPQRVYGVPNVNMDKEVIRISIQNENHNYVLLLNHYNKPNMYDLLFADLNNLDGQSISDVSTNIPKMYFTKFIIKLGEIVNSWQNNYQGENNIIWNVNIETDNNKKTFSGNGEFPNNWNEFIDLLSEYEKLFKNKKQIDIEIINDKEYNKLSFNEAINSKIKDPFWAGLVIKYFKEEEKVNDYIGKLLFKDISRYDDILNEFTKYLNQRTYDLKDAVEINGYTAKKLHELNPKFNPSGVYTFMELLRSNPVKAEEIIKSGFKNKDVIPPTNNFNGTNKSEEEMLKEIENEVDKEMIERGLLTIKDGRKIPAFGSIHVRWEIEKKLLKEKYNYDWKTPAEKNPDIMYD